MCLWCCCFGKILSGVRYQEAGTDTGRDMEMQMWSDCYRKILSGVWLPEAGRYRRLDLLLRSNQ